MPHRNQLMPTAFDESSSLESESILVRMARQRSLGDLLDCILEEARSLTHADGASMYFVRGDDLNASLEFALIYNKTLGLHANAPSGDAITIPNIPLFLDNGDANKHNVASYTVHRKKVVNIDDVYLDEKFDFTGAKKFDEAQNYRSKSFLTLPLLDHTGGVIAVMQLINATDPKTKEVVAFDHDHESTIMAMASYASVALDNQILLDSHKELLDAFIQALAGIIDVRSSHTSGHCRRIPVIMELLAEAAIENQDAPFKDFDLNEEEWYELRVAAWMHDCGKLATPDYIVDKSTKLHTLLDAIETVNVRFNALAWQTKSNYLEKIIAGGDQATLKEKMQKELDQQEEDRLFINVCNTGGEFITDEFVQRIHQIGELTYLDEVGELQPILKQWEVDNLCISRGTLNDDERATINRHIDITIDVLEKLPFPKNLRRVPEYAGGHHEKVNGTGFPRGLKKSEMSLPALMMAVADIFEALTAKDRPYKKPMPLTVTFNILTNMCLDEHIDSEIFVMFLRSNKWMDYAKEFLLESQIDVQIGGIDKWVDQLV
jgi:HD-GYP domain-containing protein (c-di-GMP phosphodiesterase class II)